MIYRISSKSCRGEILFQSTVWCGDTSRAVSTEIDTHTCTLLAPIISLLYARIMHMHIHINVVNPLPCGEILRAMFIGMSWQKHAATFQGQRDFEEIWYITCLCTSTRSYTCSMVLN